jgi:hypothetical protein
MKFVCFLAVLFSAAQTALSQYIIRVHAFSQEIIPGVAPSMNDGDVAAPKSQFTYRIFIECKPSVVVKLRSIRLNEKIHAGHLQQVESPVVQFHPTTLTNDTLVQKTPNKLLNVVLDKELGRSSRDTSGAAIFYSVRGRKYVHRTRQFTQLPPIALP